MMTRLSRRIVVAALAVCAPSAGIQAQTFSQVDEAQHVETVRELETPGPQLAPDGEVPALYSGEEADTGRQVILKEAPRQIWNWVDVSLDSEYFHTSNAFLSKTGVKGTGLLVSTIRAELEVPPIRVPGGQLLTRVGYQYQWFDFGIGGPGGNLSQLDFDVATIYAEAQYELPDGWTMLGNVAYNRLLNDGNGYDEFYKEIVPALSLEKSIQVRDNVRVTAGYSANYRFSDEVPFPSQTRYCNNRTDQALTMVLDWQVAPKVDILPFYRFQYSYYPDYLAGQPRNDFLHTIGISADYHFNSWSYVRLFLTYELRNSDASSSLDYRKFDAGGGLSAGWKF